MADRDLEGGRWLSLAERNCCNIHHDRHLSYQVQVEMEIQMFNPHPEVGVGDREATYCILKFITKIWSILTPGIIRVDMDYNESCSRDIYSTLYFCIDGMMYDGMMYNVRINDI